ncbi:hypothetical protein ECZC10_54420 [Escherichia coli]|nr:hypothetical protein ECZC10_54420 [Escherichia coli]
MKLEDLPKYYSPKSPGLTDASASTSKDALSITDVMAAQGMTQNRAEMGFSAFLGKMGISMNDRARATELLADYALSQCDRVAALRKLPAEIKPAVMRIMASYAFEDYARSAASKSNALVAGGKNLLKARFLQTRFSIRMVSRQYGQSVRKVCIRLTGKNGKKSGSW